MKLIMTLLVRNEEDIIECNIDYHLSRGVDYIIATDNLSVDATPAILERYAAKGRLHLLRETADDYAQHRWVTRMARMAAIDFHADWVINNDADEFWWPEADADLKTCLARVQPEVQALSAPRFNFPVLIAPESVGAGAASFGAAGRSAAFHAHQTVRDTASVNLMGHPLPPKVCHRANPEMEVMQGNHGVRLDGKRVRAARGPLSIFHFPLRRYEQFENKIRLGGAAYGRNNVLPMQAGSAWRALYREWQAGRLPAHFKSQTPSAEALAQGLATGRYVGDRRLTDYVQALRPAAAGSSPSRLLRAGEPPIVTTTP